MRSKPRTSAPLTQIWMGDACFYDALKDGRISLEGPVHLTRPIPGWFGQHPVLAKVVPGAKVVQGR